jgi:hypothetical protein
MGMEVRLERAGLNNFRVELEFKLEGDLKNFRGVDLRIGERYKPLFSAALREDRSKPGRIIVGFTADRALLDKSTLSVMVPMPEALGGTFYELRIKDLVDPEKGR